MNGYTILGMNHMGDDTFIDVLGAVPPYQVVQQQNAGLPPGSIPPWYSMQYPAGFVPQLLVSVDNPLEGDPFDNFEMLTEHHDEREQRGLARSHLIGAAESDRGIALHGIGFFGGGILLAYFWPGHAFWKFVLGSILGWHAATLVTGKDPAK